MPQRWEGPYHGVMSMASSRDSGAKRVRILVFLLSIAVAVTAALGWVNHVSATHRDEREDLELFLKSSSSGWVEATQEFLSNSESVAILTARVAEQLVTEESQMVAFFADLVHTYPQIDAVYLAREDSSFLFVGSEDEDSRVLRSRAYSYDQNGQRIHEQIYIAPETHLESHRERIEDDGFDARKRPWYQPAVGNIGKGFWSKPYTFASSAVPGVSYSYATEITPNNAQTDSTSHEDPKDTSRSGNISGSDLGSGGEVIVFGVDIRISALARFLSEVRPGQRGSALLVDTDGNIVARYPEITDQSVNDEVVYIGELDEGVGTLRTNGITQVVQQINSDIYLVLQADDEEFLGSAERGLLFDTATTLAVAIAAGSIVAALGHRAAIYRSRLVSEAVTDPLTGLRSRRSIELELARRLNQEGTRLSVAIIDLDRFKPVNDTFGHHAGDYVLAEIGRRLAEYARTKNCVIGRLGGDEFVVLRSSELDGEGLIEHLSAPMDWGGDQMLEVGASIGEVVIDITGDHSAEQVLQTADRALFEVKRNGRCGHIRTTDI